ncbi:pantoate--beta-alanine ligase [bacterium]|nr:pantoate--beta-alanine ligase [bacterium]
MKIIRTVQEMQTLSGHLRMDGKKIAFVPTMGYLHEGHLSLIRTACRQADVVVISIYVNPAQFGPNEDFEQYPRDIERDARLATREGADIIFFPSDTEMYSKEHLTYVTVDDITGILCGASRPTHFRGVTTICAKLFHVINPHFAVFGQKDYQQSVVIRRMVKDLNFDMNIIVAPIVREEDGLAMSSRNAYLSAEERKDALSLHAALKLAEDKVRQGHRKSADLIREMTELIRSKTHTKIDYIQIVHPEDLHNLDVIEDRAVAVLAVFAGKTRLIDNVILEV